jgi:hypothetical protein
VLILLFLHVIYSIAPWRVDVGRGASEYYRNEYAEGVRTGPGNVMGGTAPALIAFFLPLQFFR